MAAPPPEAQDHHLKSFQPQFPLFPFLPLEIRIKIWLLTLPGHRLIHLSTPTNSSHPQWGHYPFSKHACFARYAYIPTLSICRESRAIALPFYSFVTFLHPRSLLPFSPELDVLVVDHQTLRSFMKLRTWRKRDEVDKGEGLSVRRLVLKLDMMDHSIHELLLQAITYFGYLEKVVFCLMVSGTGEGERDPYYEEALLELKDGMRSVGWTLREDVSWGMQLMGRIKIPIIMSLRIPGGSEVEMEERIWAMENFWAGIETTLPVRTIDPAMV